MTVVSSTDFMATADVFTNEYLGCRNAAGDIERDWYLRPRQPRKRKPTASGVYVRRNPDGWVGFVYFDANRGRWLMAFERRASAQGLADDYLAERDPSLGVYASTYQDVPWSLAPDGLNAFGYPLDTEALLTLALLRHAVDPKLRLRGIR